MSETESSQSSQGRLKPAPMEQGGERKFWFGVRALCVSEAWSLLFGSGVLWYLGLMHNRVLMSGLAFGGVSVFVFGDQVETWLGIMSREPLLNERDEMDSTAPTERAIRYIFPPLIAGFGVIGAAVNTVVIPILTSAVSLGLFLWILRRILTIWRNRDPIAES